MCSRIAICVAVLLPATLVLASASARAQEPSAEPILFPPACVRFQLADDQKGGDLTLDNLFTAGWCEEFRNRQTTGGAERIILFRTLPPFQDRELLGNYRFALHSQPGGVNQNELGPELLLPLNRRLMFDAELSYNFNGTNQPDTGGANGAMATAVQLVDTACSAISVLASLNTPGRVDLLDHRLFLGFGAAGFRDLGARFGLQGSLAFYLPLGSSHDTGSDVEMSYTAALTWTLTDNLPWFGHFTPFVEVAGVTDLGLQERRTFVTVLPGAEWELIHDWWLAAGVEVPVASPRPFDLGVHFSVIWAF
jgi:hypothetical protein